MIIAVFVGKLIEVKDSEPFFIQGWLRCMELRFIEVYANDFSHSLYCAVAYELRRT